MNNAALLQHVFSGSPYREGIRIAFERHFEYCAQHKMDYHLVESDVCPDWPKQGDWPKLPVIRQLLALYPFVFYVDADAMIWDVRMDLREAFAGSSAAILAAQHPGPPTHLNVGVMFFRDDARMERFFDAWIAARPGGPPWWEQTVFNQLAVSPDFVGMVERMDDRWNSTYQVNESPVPVIRGWHGGWEVQRKMVWMAEALATLPQGIGRR